MSRSGLAALRISLTNSRHRRWRDARCLLENILTNLLRLRLGLNSKLSLQYLDAALILIERRASTAVFKVESHKNLVNSLLQGIQPEESQRSLNGCFVEIVFHLMHKKFLCSIPRQLAKSLTLGHEPLLEHLFFHVQTFEKLTSVELSGPLKGRRGAVADELLELRNVHLYRRRGQSDRVLFEDQAARARVRQGLPDGGNGLPEAMPGLLPFFVPPEQRRNFIPRMGLSRPEREISQERAVFFRGKSEGRTRRESSLKPSKKAQCEQSHMVLSEQTTICHPYITPASDSQAGTNFGCFFDDSLTKL
jgi:hypothetical protein